MTKRVDNPLDRPDTNSGKEWSKMDDLDLRISLTAGKDIAETAAFLCRIIEETQARAVKLGIKSPTSDLPDS